MNGAAISCTPRVNTLANRPSSTIHTSTTAAPTRKSTAGFRKLQAPPNSQPAARPATQPPIHWPKK